MSQVIACQCSACKEFVSIPWEGQKKISCPHCQHNLGKVADTADIFSSCPMCPCRQFYLSKNFNQFLGCLIMGVGIILAFWTYGLSLPVFAFIDWLLFRNVPYILNCYRCGCEFHGFDDAHDRFKPFLHHIGLKYDKYR